jgi:hypothetical protein
MILNSILSKTFFGKTKGNVLYKEQLFLTAHVK